MGGNTRAIDRETGEVLAYADKIDLQRVSRRRFRTALRVALVKVSDAHALRTGSPLWDEDNREQLLSEGYAFNGSSEHLMGDLVSDNDLIKYKPVFGDIDVTIPHEHLGSLFELLGEYENKEISGRIAYVGQNKLDQHGHQINALFRYSDDGIAFNFQVDFEGTDYVNGLPVEFGKFAHSSAWADIKLGLKGVGHKYWLINLVRAISENTSLVQLTDKSPLPPLPVRLKKVAPGEHPRSHAFSVDRGLRTKMKPVVHNGKPLRIDGKIAVKELPTSESEYVKDLRDIYTFLFDREPTPAELDGMWSLSGLVDLCVKYVPEHKLESAYLFMLNENLFGPAAQKLDRLSKETDEETKMRIVNFLRKWMPYLKDFNFELERLKREFYARY